MAQGFRDYSRARPSYVAKRLPRKNNFALFAQLFAVGAAFALSFGYVSNDTFRQSVTNAVTAILPEPPAPRSATEVQNTAASIDPFAAVSYTSEPLPSKPVAIVAKPSPPPPAVVQLKKITPSPPLPKAVPAKPTIVVQSTLTPIPMPPLPKPVTQVAALKVANPFAVVPSKITPAAAPPPVAIENPVAHAIKPPVVAAPITTPPVVASPITKPLVVVPAPVAAAQPTPAKPEKAIVAQVVPAPVVQIPVPSKPAKIQERIELPPVPIEKTAERLVPQRTQGDVVVDCENCPELVVVVGTPDYDLKTAQNANYDGVKEVLPAFAIGTHEVTFDDWDRCVTEGGCTAKPPDEGWGRGRRPVIDVSFNDINDQFLPWLSRVSKHKYRLPSEAEWELAVRGGSQANAQFAYSFGNNEALLCEYGNSSDLAAKTADSNWSGTPCNDGFAKTAPVGSLKPNALGIFDMHGNVWEWVSDCLRSGYSTDPVKNAFDCNFRVLRGGSWASQAATLRSAERGWEKPVKQKNSIGFRVARSLP